MDSSKHSSVKKLFMELDELNYISIIKNGSDISFYICQLQVCLKLSKDEMLMVLSLKSVIEEMITYLSKTRPETLV